VRFSRNSWKRRRSKPQRDEQHHLAVASILLSSPGMKSPLLALALLIVGSVSHSAESSQDTTRAAKRNEMSNQKKVATLWYEAFSKKDPAILDRILHEQWVDIPAPPGTPPGPAGVKPIFERLTTTFPDLDLAIKDILQDGDKVVVRAEMKGTQREAFMGFPSKNRSLAIQVVDIHEIKDGKIVRTWHTEDWMSGLRQLGAFEK
jgi:steroid delta-isomerase-like uncharacterized protein